MSFGNNLFIIKRQMILYFFITIQTWIQNIFLRYLILSRTPIVTFLC